MQKVFTTEWLLEAAIKSWFEWDFNPWALNSVQMKKRTELSGIYVYVYIHLYDSQIVHHNPCFNLFILHNNSFDNQGSEINKNDILLRFDKRSFTKTFFLLQTFFPILYKDFINT